MLVGAGQAFGYTQRIQHGSRMAPKRSRFRTRRPMFVLLMICASATIIWVLLGHLEPLDQMSEDASQAIPNASASHPQDVFGSEQAVKADISPSPQMNLTRHFRDNLDPTRKYVTSFVSAGLANQIISLLHLLQIAIHSHRQSTASQLSVRTPVLPPFAPIHVNALAGFFPFGDVFDIPRLSETLGLEVLEWRDIKHVAPSDADELRDIASRLGTPRAYVAGHFGGLMQEDDIGCWSLIMRQVMDPKKEPKWGEVWHGEVPKALSLDVSWTPIPSGLQSLAREGTNIVDLAYLANLSEEKERRLALAHLDEEEAGSLKTVPTLTGISHRRIEPESHLLCFDFLFYTAFSNDDAINIKDDSLNTALDTIGIHLHFTRALEDIAMQVLRKVIPPFSTDPFVEEGKNSFPPYIAVHIRRNDFEQYCPRVPSGSDRSEGCFTPISTWVEAVNNVRYDLINAQGMTQAEVSSLPVLIFSDEPKRTTQWFMNRFHRPAGTSEAWWAAIDELDWISIDHQSPEIDTEERWGYWYPILLDQVVMSHAIGFVGTDMSTFSMMAGKRVNGWWDGPIQMVRPVVDGLGRRVE